MAVKYLIWCAPLVLALVLASVIALDVLRENRSAFNRIFHAIMMWLGIFAATLNYTIGLFAKWGWL